MAFADAGAKPSEDLHLSRWKQARPYFCHVNELQAVDLPLYHPVATRQMQRRGDCVLISAEVPSKACVG